MEFSLQKTNENEWNLLRVNAEIFSHEKKDRQPGEPLHSTFVFDNIGNEQPMTFIITAVDGDASEIVLEINNYKEVRLPVVLRKGQIIKYTEGNWKLWKKSYF